MTSALSTPMMRQYLAIKARHPDAIVFYRMGDFYEMFLRDAEVAAPLLDIALTTRDKGKPDAVPMCGVPVHAAEGYIKRLAEAGHRVAICEQVEEPGSRRAGTSVRSGRGLVRREVIEVVTPGLVGDPSGVDAAAEISLVALAAPEKGEHAFGLAALDSSTGDFRATQVAGAREEVSAQGLPTLLSEEIARIAPREILIPHTTEGTLGPALRRVLPNVALSVLADAAFARSPERPESALSSIEGAARRAADALLGYLQAHQPFALVHTAGLRPYQLSDTMVLDAPTRIHLELFVSAEDGSRRGTLVERVDQTCTPPGARRLARWLAYPLLSSKAIAARQDAVAWLAEHQEADGNWDEPYYTGTGFPGDFYLNYHLYRLAFPLSALGRYVRGTYHD